MRPHSPSPARACLIAALAMLLFAACKRSTSPTERPPVCVAAAADLTGAFEELGRAFQQQTGRPVVFSFGSTGLLAKQLREGAPFDLFAAANVSFVDDVVAAGVCDGISKASYARGRIAIWSKRGDVPAPVSLEDLVDPRYQRIAIANPEHAPYGQAAREAFQQAGLWSRVENRLVYGENVRQTLQLAETGNVEVAIVALSIVVRDRENPWTLVDERLHRPIEQTLVVCTRGQDRDGGQAFGHFVGSPRGREVMRIYGFLLPGAAVGTSRP